MEPPDQKTSVKDMERMLKQIAETPPTSIYKNSKFKEIIPSDMDIGVADLNCKMKWVVKSDNREPLYSSSMMGFDGFRPPTYFVLDHSDLNQIMNRSTTSQQFCEWTSSIDGLADRNKKFYLRAVPFSYSKDFSTSYVFYHEVFPVLRALLKRQKSWKLANIMHQNKYQYKCSSNEITLIHVPELISILDQFDLDKSQITLIRDPMFEMTSREAIHSFHSPNRFLDCDFTERWTKGHILFTLFQNEVCGINWNKDYCTHSDCMEKQKSRILFAIYFICKKPEDITSETTVVPIEDKCIANHRTSLSKFDYKLDNVKYSETIPWKQYLETCEAFGLTVYTQFKQNNKIAVWLARVLYMTAWMDQFYNVRQWKEMITDELCYKVPTNSVPSMKKFWEPMLQRAEERIKIKRPVFIPDIVNWPTPEELYAETEEDSGKFEDLPFTKQETYRLCVGTQKKTLYEHVVKEPAAEWVCQEYEESVEDFVQKRHDELIKSFISKRMVNGDPRLLEEVDNYLEQVSEMTGQISKEEATKESDLKAKEVTEAPKAQDSKANTSEASRKEESQKADFEKSDPIELSRSGICIASEVSSKATPEPKKVPGAPGSQESKKLPPGIQGTSKSKAKIEQESKKAPPILESPQNLKAAEEKATKKGPIPEQEASRSQKSEEVEKMNDFREFVDAFSKIRQSAKSEEEIKEACKAPEFMKVMMRSLSHKSVAESLRKNGYEYCIMESMENQEAAQQLFVGKRHSPAENTVASQEGKEKGSRKQETEMILMTWHLLLLLPRCPMKRDRWYGRIQNIQNDDKGDILEEMEMMSRRNFLDGRRWRVISNNTVLWSSSYLNTSDHFVFDHKDSGWLENQKENIEFSSYVDDLVKRNQPIYIRMIPLSYPPSKGCHVFTDNLFPVIKALLKKQNTWTTANQMSYYKYLLMASINKNAFISRSDLYKILEQLDIDKSKITLIRDPIYEKTRLQAIESFEAPIRYHNCEGNASYSWAQYLFHNFQHFVCGINWKKDYCRKHSFCLRDYEMELFSQVIPIDKQPDVGFKISSLVEEPKCIQKHCAMLSKFDYKLDNLKYTDTIPWTQYLETCEAFGLTVYDNLKNDEIPVWMARVLYMTSWMDEYSEDDDWKDMIMREMCHKVPENWIPRIKEFWETIAGYDLNWEEDYIVRTKFCNTINWPTPQRLYADRLAQPEQMYCFLASSKQAEYKKLNDECRKWVYKTVREESGDEWENEQTDFKGSYMDQPLLRTLFRDGIETSKLRMAPRNGRQFCEEDLEDLVKGGTFEMEEEEEESDWDEEEEEEDEQDEQEEESCLDEEEEEDPENTEKIFEALQKVKMGYINNLPQEAREKLGIQKPLEAAKKDSEEGSGKGEAKKPLPEAQKPPEALPKVAEPSGNPATQKIPVSIEPISTSVAPKKNTVEISRKVEANIPIPMSKKVLVASRESDLKEPAQKSLENTEKTSNQGSEASKNNSEGAARKILVPRSKKILEASQKQDLKKPNPIEAQKPPEAPSKQSGIKEVGFSRSADTDSRAEKIPEASRSPKLKKSTQGEAQKPPEAPSKTATPPGSKSLQIAPVPIKPESISVTRPALEASKKEASEEEKAPEASRNHESTENLAALRSDLEPIPKSRQLDSGRYPVKDDMDPHDMFGEMVTAFMSPTFRSEMFQFLRTAGVDKSIVNGYEQFLDGLGYVSGGSNNPGDTQKHSESMTDGGFDESVVKGYEGFLGLLDSKFGQGPEKSISVETQNLSRKQAVAGEEEAFKKEEAKKSEQVPEASRESDSKESAKKPKTEKTNQDSEASKNNSEEATRKILVPRSKKVPEASKKQDVEKLNPIDAQKPPEAPSKLAESSGSPSTQKSPVSIKPEPISVAKPASEAFRKNSEEGTRKVDKKVPVTELSHREQVLEAVKQSESRKSEPGKAQNPPKALPKVAEPPGNKQLRKAPVSIKPESIPAAPKKNPVEISRKKEANDPIPEPKRVSEASEASKVPELQKKGESPESKDLIKNKESQLCDNQKCKRINENLKKTEAELKKAKNFEKKAMGTERVEKENKRMKKEMEKMEKEMEEMKKKVLESNRKEIEEKKLRESMEEENAQMKWEIRGLKQESVNDKQKIAQLSQKVDSSQLQFTLERSAFEEEIHKNNARIVEFERTIKCLSNQRATDPSTSNLDPTRPDLKREEYEKIRDTFEKDLSMDKAMEKVLKLKSLKSNPEIQELCDMEIDQLQKSSRIYLDTVNMNIQKIQVQPLFSIIAHPYFQVTNDTSDLILLPKLPSLSNAFNKEYNKLPTPPRPPILLDSGLNQEVDCYICFKTLRGEQLWWCRNCKKPAHRHCVKKWTDTQKSWGKPEGDCGLCRKFFKPPNRRNVRF
uniref:RNA-directed RNA polymerase n=1 Tax=Caenorhabditis tropicalis TaxID=1561998 RepID=A0A1I7UP83_9PELO